jgi:hypothetical protein
MACSVSRPGHRFRSAQFEQNGGLGNQWHRWVRRLLRSWKALLARAWRNSSSVTPAALIILGVRSQPSSSATPWNRRCRFSAASGPAEDHTTQLCVLVRGDVGRVTGRRHELAGPGGVVTEHVGQRTPLALPWESRTWHRLHARARGWFPRRRSRTPDRPASSPRSPVVDLVPFTTVSRAPPGDRAVGLDARAITCRTPARSRADVRNC